LNSHPGGENPHLVVAAILAALRRITDLKSAARRSFSMHPAQPTARRMQFREPVDLECAGRAGKRSATPL